MKYTTIVKEFFHMMNQSEILKNLANPNPSLYIGMNAIHRVFEFILLKTNNIENAYYYSQKSYFYYLEYMEQIHKADLLQNLNHMDAILFVYKKTIFDIYDGEIRNTSDTISNIMTLHDETIIVDEKEIKLLLNTMSNFTKTLFYWENDKISFSDRIKICNQYLHRYLQRIDALELTNSYLEVIQQKYEMNYNKYDELLCEMVDKIEKTKKINMINDSEKDEYFLMKFYVEEHVFHEKFHEGTTKDLVKWLFVSPI